MPTETNPVTVYASSPTTPMPRLPATAFLHVWLDTALNDPAGRPVFCPRCRLLAGAVMVGRALWFRVDPCGCLFEIGA